MPAEVSETTITRLGVASAIVLIVIAIVEPSAGNLAFAAAAVIAVAVVIWLGRQRP
jgi:hypothetical protein